MGVGGQGLLNRIQDWVWLKNPKTSSMNLWSRAKKRVQQARQHQDGQDSW